ncbi:MAG: hypothetical protein CFH02_00743, partial [Alphaproteobacteria bacterium MarineAlpha3_Bin1]
MTRGSKSQTSNRPANQRNRRLLSPLTRRILAVNILALALLGAGVLFHGEYRKTLIEAELKSLTVQAQMFAAALGEGAIPADTPSRYKLIPKIAEVIMRRMVETTGTR